MAAITRSLAYVPNRVKQYTSWTPEQIAGIYRTLLEPDGPIYLAGEHLSNLTGWQEGAILSAHRAIEKIAQHARA